MAFDTKRLYDLLPAIHRIRDAEQGEPLKALVAVIAEQATVLEEDLAQLYDDQFIETCAEWVVPYIGDLIGVRQPYEINLQVGRNRAEVANTIGYRRRKGTAAVLEQLARDVTGWNANVVEFFQLLATTQYMKHLRPENLSWIGLRDWERLERLNTPFDKVAHTAEMRRIASRRGRYNIPNIGIFLWRLSNYSLTNSPAFQLDNRRYLFSPLGNNTQLFNRPQTEETITHLAEPINVPIPLSRRVLAEYLEDYYGEDKSLFLIVDGIEIKPDPDLNQKLSDLIKVCDLSDLKDINGNVIGWAHLPQDKIAIDPVLGRIALPEAKSSVIVTYHYGFSADMGGGEYDRDTSLGLEITFIRRVPNDFSTIQAALTNFTSGVIEITNSGHYQETLAINVTENQSLELRSADGFRPTLVLEEDLAITGGENAQVTLNGLLISGGSLTLPATDTSNNPNQLKNLRLRHCTLVPGINLQISGEPEQPDQPSITVESGNTNLEIDRCIVGGLRVINSDNIQVSISNSIVDATDQDKVAYAAIDGQEAGAKLSIKNSTIIGQVHTEIMELASNTIFLASLAEVNPWQAPILADRRQEGCVRFSSLPLESLVPRRYRCQPNLALSDRVLALGLTEIDQLPPSEQAVILTRLIPQFTSLRYGNPGYCQLSQRCAVEIRTGADDEAEMGAFHDLYQPQRETNLRLRLDEYLRFGLEAGIFYAT